MNEQEIKDFIKNSLQELYQVDADIINRELKEECINHRFAVALENQLKVKKQQVTYDVDVEYNGNYTGQDDEDVLNKKLIDLTMDGGFRKSRIYPDIIIHKRKSNEFNLLCIEAKKRYSNSKLRRDKFKVRGLLEAPFNYRFGCVVEYLPNLNHYQVYLFRRINNQIIEENFLVQK